METAEEEEFMADVEVKVRDNGPYRVTGPFKLIDATGAEFTLEG